MPKDVLLTNNEHDKTVDIVTQIGKDRLCVDAVVSAIENNADRFKPRFYISDTQITLTSQETDTELLDLDFDGKIDSIAVNFTRDDVEFALFADSVEILRVDMEDMRHDKFYLGNWHYRHTSNFPVTIGKCGKQIIISWVNYPADILTNLTIKAKKTTSKTVKMDSIFVTYRIRVV